MTLAPSIVLNSGVAIPQVGIGVLQIPPEDTEPCVLTALELGYRHIDTAQGYGNESGVGAAVRHCGLDRDQIFVTTKLNNNRHGYDKAVAAFETSLKVMGLDYVDLFLIHWPLPQQDLYVSTWQALEQIAASGRARSIGVSNFTPAHLQRLEAETGMTPAVNQIQVHPYWIQSELREFTKARNIAVEAWSPLARNLVLGESSILEIAERIERTPSQVVLRWHVQRGDIVLPKSTNRDRLASNLALFDFVLSAADVACIDGLDRADGRIGPAPEDMNVIPAG
jgi:2,5-diketo-D-gluconate reductase A